MEVPDKNPFLLNIPFKSLRKEALKACLFFEVNSKNILIPCKSTDLTALVWNNFTK